MNRRDALKGILKAMIAPAIIPVERLMRIKPIVVPEVVLGDGGCAKAAWYASSGHRWTWYHCTPRYFTEGHGVPGIPELLMRLKQNEGP